jgi:hypothetical protein
MDFWSQVLLAFMVLLVLVGIYIGYLTCATKPTAELDAPLIEELPASSDSRAPSDATDP